MAENKLTTTEKRRMDAYLAKLDQLDGDPEDLARLNDEYGDIVAKMQTEIAGKENDPESVAGLMRIYAAIKENRMNLQMFADDPDAEALHTQLAAIARYGFMNDKVNRELIARPPEIREIDGQYKMFWGVEQVPSRAKDNTPFAPVIMALSGEGIQTNQKITADDDAVFTATANIIYAGQQRNIKTPYYVTPQDVWRRMNGITDNRKSPSKKQLDAVCKSLDKMRFTKLHMDISREIKANCVKIDDDRLTEGVVEDYYLPAAKVTFKTEKGKELTGYRFDRMPFLYDYNVAKGHVLLVNYDLLDTSDTTGNEGYTIAFRNYLLREIALMYARGRNNTLIKYETIYKVTDIPAPADRIRRSNYKTEESYKAVLKRTAKNDRDKVAALLESWKRKKWILDYEQDKPGRTIIGVKIKLNPKNYTTQPAKKR